MVLYRCVLRQFSVSPTHTRAHFAHKLQKITKHFQYGYKQRQNWNTERIMQFFKIAAYVQIANCMAWCIMRLVHFCSYINCLRLALVGVAYQAFYMMLACMGVECVRVWEYKRVWQSCVFVNVDVKYIIHYKRMCKFICSL